MKRWIKYLGILLTACSLAACWGDNDDSPGTIAKVAEEKGLTALSAAAAKAGLAGTLDDPNATLTVFAPTDAAFAALATQLGFASATDMVNALPASTLASLLSYHVLGSEKSASDLAAGGATQPTLYVFEGSAAALGVSAASGVTLSDAALTSGSVTTADIEASNGVIHIVDKVLIPPGVLNVVQMAQVNPIFSSLVSAIVSADLQATLSGAGPFTVFAPTNDAFADIADIVANLSPEELTAVLTYHVLPAQVLAADIPFGAPVATIEGETITINEGTPPTITDTTATPAPIIAVDVRASNGVIHVVSKVLLPTL